MLISDCGVHFDYFKVIHKAYFGVGGAKKVFSLFWAILWSKLEKL